MKESLSFGTYLSYEKGKVIIRGIALTEGMYKGIFYPAEELEKAYKDLIGKPVILEHGLSDRKTEVLGRVTKAEYDPFLKSILFEAEVDDKSVLDKYNIKGVSCSILLERKVENGIPVARNLEFDELSLTSAPACETALVVTKEYLSKLFDNSGTSSSSTEKERGGSMSEEKKPERKTCLYAIVKLSEEQLEELKNKYPVPYYYYGYEGEYKYPYYPYGYMTPEQYKEYYEKYVAPYYQEYYEYYGYPGYGYPEIKCPVCETTFKTFPEFLKHWEKEHKEKYGEYKSKEQQMKERVQELEKQLTDTQRAVEELSKKLEQTWNEATEKTLSEIKKAKQELAKELEKVIPPQTIVSQWGLGAQRFVSEVRKLIRSLSS